MLHTFIFDLISIKISGKQISSSVFYEKKKNCGHTCPSSGFLLFSFPILTGNR